MGQIYEVMLPYLNYVAPSIGICKDDKSCLSITLIEIGYACIDCAKEEKFPSIFSPSQSSWAKSILSYVNFIMWNPP